MPIHGVGDYLETYLCPLMSTGGCGGGILILNALELCKINGKLSANGQDASSRGGGGAGGSIHITTYEFDGTGEIQVKGGKGRNGGSGGRLAISSFIDFADVDFFSDGGVGNGGEGGAAGTVYTKDNSTADGQKTLRIYNRKGEGVGKLTFLYEPHCEKTE